MENEFMKTENIIEGRNIQKRLRNFELNIPQLNISKGFATALIGENGAGKTTLLRLFRGDGGLKIPSTPVFIRLSDI